MQQAAALTLYYHKFDPETNKWQVIRKGDGSVRAAFTSPVDAADYAMLRGEYDFERLGKRIPTIPPPFLLCQKKEKEEEREKEDAQ